MAKSVEPKISKSLMLSIGMHTVLLSLFLITFSCSEEKTILVNLQKDPQPQTKRVKAALIDKSVVDRAVNRQAMEEKLRQQKILEQQQLAEKMRLEAEQARIDIENAKAEKIRIEAATKKAAIEKAALEKQQQLAKKQLAQQKLEQQKLEQQKIAQQAAQQSLIQKTIEAQKAAKKAADAAALKSNHDRLQVERQNFLESEVDKFKAEFAAAIEDNRILSAVFTGDMRCKVRIRLLPDGSILNVSVMQSSGNSAYDDMSIKAVYKTAPFSMPDDKELYEQLRDIVLSFRNGEQSNDG